MNDAPERWPAPERNKGPIIAVLAAHVIPALPGADGRGRRPRVLEIASGTGQHAVAFSRAFPQIEWLPSDPDPSHRESIEAWRRFERSEGAGDNLLAPVAIDVRALPWPIDSADAVVCSNMIHIAPWECTLALLDGVAAVLPEGGLLFIYGPFFEGGRQPAPSNVAFDAQLRAQDPTWGVRDLDRVTELARARGLLRLARVEMPANNLSVVFRRDAQD